MFFFRWLSWHGDRRRDRFRCGRIGWSYWFGRGQRCKVLIWSSWRAYFDSVPLQKRDLMISYNHIKPWGGLPLFILHFSAMIFIMSYHTLPHFFCFIILQLFLVCIDMWGWNKVINCMFFLWNFSFFKGNSTTEVCQGFAVHNKMYCIRMHFFGFLFLIKYVYVLTL